ncbi:MAG: BolA family transcriptional regulator [Alphaproteobacteria bacterium]|nr:BolA family transcriptional regulator [Alphaproteobacteria bacterium]
MTVAERIRHKLTEALQPVHLEVRDDSHLHAGHAGARPEGETHFFLHVVADAFTGKSRVQRQRLVNDILAEELAGPVHALSMRTLSPGETRGVD